MPAFASVENVLDCGAGCGAESDAAFVDLGGAWRVFADFVRVRAVGESGLGIFVLGLPIGSVLETLVDEAVGDEPVDESTTSELLSAAEEEVDGAG